MTHSQTLFFLFFNKLIFICDATEQFIEKKFTIQKTNTIIFPDSLLVLEIN